MVFLLSVEMLLGIFCMLMIVSRTTNLSAHTLKDRTFRQCMKIHKHFQQQQPHPITTVRNKHYIKIDSLAIPIRIEEMNGIQIIHVLSLASLNGSFSLFFFLYSERPWKAGLTLL